MQTVPRPPQEHPKRWHLMLGSTQVSQGCEPTLSRTKTELFLLRHPRRRCLRSIYPWSGCERWQESHLAVCKRLPAPTCKNKLGNWDQLPSPYVSKPHWFLSSALQGCSWTEPPAPVPAGQTQGMTVSPEKKATESPGCAAQEQRHLPPSLNRRSTDALLLSTPTLSYFPSSMEEMLRAPHPPAQGSCPAPSLGVSQLVLFEGCSHRSSL